MKTKLFLDTTKEVRACPFLVQREEVLFREEKRREEKRREEPSLWVEPKNTKRNGVLLFSSASFLWLAPEKNSENRCCFAVLLFCCFAVFFCCFSLKNSEKRRDDFFY